MGVSMFKRIAFNNKLMVAMALFNNITAIDTATDIQKNILTAQINFKFEISSIDFSLYECEGASRHHPLLPLGETDTLPHLRGVAPLLKCYRGTPSLGL